MSLNIPKAEDLEGRPPEQVEAMLKPLIDRCDELFFHVREDPANFQDLRELCCTKRDEVIDVLQHSLFAQSIIMELRALRLGESIVRPKHMSEQEAVILFGSLLHDFQEGTIDEEETTRRFIMYNDWGRGIFNMLGCGISHELEILGHVLMTAVPGIDDHLKNGIR